ncbi:MAG: DNA mismatch repair protein MutS [Deltaproteobacteria bacterium]|nr:DNA mismatch repair protein MutS [Deltaproteobacteria bacterium]
MASLDPSREEERLFQEAMRDVVPLSARHRSRIPSPATAKRPPSFLALEELDVKTHLMDLVRGEVPFQVTHSDEYIDGAIRGLSPKVLKKLRDGDFSYQAHLDLHGLNRMQAYPLVVQFIKESFAQKRRCVLIVSGRGLNSVEKEPILKLSLVHWLTHAPLKRLVLAFASARSYDGGAGAFYILLRRNESRHPVHVPAP